MKLTCDVETSTWTATSGFAVACLRVFVSLQDALRGTYVCTRRSSRSRFATVSFIPFHCLLHGSRQERVLPVHNGLQIRHLRGEKKREMVGGSYVTFSHRPKGHVQMHTTFEIYGFTANILNEVS